MPYLDVVSWPRLENGISNLGKTRSHKFRVSPISDHSLLPANALCVAEDLFALSGTSLSITEPRVALG